MLHYLFLKVNLSKSNLTRVWITKGIKVSCKRKNELLVLCKITNHFKLKLYYLKYCLILTKVINNTKSCTITLFFSNLRT